MPTREYERLGLDDEFYEILGLRVPLIRMPVAPGRSIAILVEVAARNQLLRARGHHAARELAERLDAARCATTRLPPDEDDEELEGGGGTVSRESVAALGRRDSAQGTAATARRKPASRSSS